MGGKSDFGRFYGIDYGINYEIKYLYFNIFYVNGIDGIDFWNNLYFIIYNNNIYKKE